MNEGGTDGDAGVGYRYSCLDCGVEGEVVASIAEAQDRFDACAANDHAPSFERIDASDAAAGE